MDTDAAFRRSYYFLSYLFVKALVDRTSVAEFMKFYDSQYSDALFESTFKVKRLDLVCELKMDLKCG